MLDSYRIRLLVIWCVGFVVPLLLILFQYLSGKYGDKWAEVLGWLTALTLSTISLMIGVMVSNPVEARDSDLMDKPEGSLTQKEKAAKAVIVKKDSHEKNVFYIAAGASITYLLIINLAFFAEPLVSEKPQELMRDSKLWLAIPATFTSLLIGYFFGKK